jgi:hypothetical protein
LYTRCETLYPAAYPRPGNSERNFVVRGLVAASLKMMGDNVEKETYTSSACKSITIITKTFPLEHTLALLLIKRFATVSTGWKIRSSAIPVKNFL